MSSHVCARTWLIRMAVLLKRNGFDFTNRKEMIHIGQHILKAKFLGPSIAPRLTPLASESPSQQHPGKLALMQSSAKILQLVFLHPSLFGCRFQEVSIKVKKENSKTKLYITYSHDNTTKIAKQ
jgi:hypothetical protein